MPFGKEIYKKLVLQISKKYQILQPEMKKIIASNSKSCSSKICEIVQNTSGLAVAMVKSNILLPEILFPVSPTCVSRDFDVFLSFSQTLIDVLLKYLH